MKKILFIMMLISIMSISNQKSILAFKSGYNTYELGEEEKRKYLNHKINIATDEPVLGAPIESFAVNDNGDVAAWMQGEKISRGSWSHCIQVYDKNGMFKYRTYFSSEYDRPMEWDGENLVIKYKNACLLVNEEGRVLDARGYVEGEYSKSNARNIRVRTQKKNGDKYEMSRSFLSDSGTWFNPGYSMLVKTAEDGTVTVFYDYDAEMTARNKRAIAVLAFFPFAFGFAMWINFSEKAKQITRETPATGMGRIFNPVTIGKIIIAAFVIYTFISD